MHGNPIPEQRMGASGLRGRLSFILSVWMALATALICAVVPAGLPATRTIGSAFDPSTTIVALRTKPPVTARAAILRSGDRDGSGIGLGGWDRPMALAAEAPAVVLGRTTFTAISGFVAAALSFAPPTLSFALFARPPPAS